jgi:hypothetical protein
MIKRSALHATITAALACSKKMENGDAIIFQKWSEKIRKIDTSPFPVDIVTSKVTINHDQEL